MIPRLAFPGQETAMLHIVHMIERRFPERAGTVTRTFLLASGALLAGIGLLLMG